MNQRNKKYLWGAIQQTGDELKGRLPEDPRHPSGRNPYAHVASCLREHFTCSYKDLPDDLLDDALRFLESLKS